MLMTSPTSEAPGRQLYDQQAAIEHDKSIRPVWVVMRPTSRRLRRRKAVSVSEVSLPRSGHSSPSADDPELSDGVCKRYVSLLLFKLPRGED